MKITALWERPAAHERWGGVFILIENGELLNVTQEKNFTGNDKQGTRTYKETGNLELSAAFNPGDKFDFKKAHHFMKAFGGQLVKKF